MKSPTLPKVLLFDVMSTLIYDPFLVEMPRFFGMSMDELLAAKDPTAWQTFELGDISEEQFLKRFFADGRTFDQAGFKACVFEAYRWLDGMQELTLELKDAGHQLHTLSNYPSWYQQIEARLELSRNVEWSFVSCEIGVRKPDPRAFSIPLDELGVDAKDCLFVDDQLLNCEAASREGMHAIHFRDGETLRGELVALGLLAT
ncbi:MAG: FMN phosphatase YigB (HAD superfamily) [Candidatus Paceibacteria bacterium]|jgi:FMN phosphatase YigB (HAD superfamily)